SGCAYRPAAFACQISMRESGTTAPAPSRTTPSMVMWRPFACSVAMRAQPGSLRQIAKNGPTVWNGVGSAMMRFHGRCVAAAQDDVEAIAERVFRLREGKIEARDQP